MPYTTLIFDLDGTLYPGDNGVWEAIAARMNLYMQVKMGLNHEEVISLREQYYKKYGTTLSGLRQFHEVDELEYLSFVHDIPIDDYLHPDHELREALGKLPQTKWVFTNADRAHTDRVLRALNIQDCFQGILDIQTFNFLNKPNPLVYQQALKLIGSPNPGECVFFDDSPKNLAPAKELGMTTVLVGENSAGSDADYTIPKIHLIATLPGLSDQI